MLSPNRNTLHEENIGVRLPDGTRHMATVRVGALDSDEDVLQRISSRVGTIFNVTGVKYQLVSADPFRLKKLSNSEDGTPIVEVIKTLPTTPIVGERWKPKDPRRKTSFTVKEVFADHILTDDGRTIQLARFSRYERA